MLMLMMMTEWVQTDTETSGSAWRGLWRHSLIGCSDVWRSDEFPSPIDPQCQRTHRFAWTCHNMNTMKKRKLYFTQY